MTTKPLFISKLLPSIIIATVIFALPMHIVGRAHADQLIDRSVTMSNSTVGQAGVRYTTSFTISNSYVLGSFSIEFCANSPIPSSVCVAPTGFDATGVTIIQQAGISGLSINSGSTANTVILGRTPAAIAPGAIAVELGGITNPSTVGTFYAKFKTYSSNNGSGTHIDEGGAALNTTNAFAITTDVPPYILFCVAIQIPGFSCASASGDSINLGEFSTISPKTSTSQLLIGSNAAYGFNVYVTGTTLTSGNNVIPALTTPTPSIPGQSQFGINLTANSNPSIGSLPVGDGTAPSTSDYSIANRYKFVSGDIIAQTATTSAFRKFTTSYIVNIDNAQRPGIYTTTLLYSILATF